MRLLAQSKGARFSNKDMIVLKFVMVVAASSMFAFRIGFAYICVKLFDMGVLGIWIAMVSDWLIRFVFFEIRFKKGNWKTNKVI